MILHVSNGSAQIHLNKFLELRIGIFKQSTLSRPTPISD